MAGAAGCFSMGRPAVEPAVVADRPGTASSLVLRRMDRRGLVWAKQHGTKSGSGAPLRRGLLLNENVSNFTYDCRFLL